MKHYDLRLDHFKIYLGFNSGLIIVTGYLLKPYLENTAKNSSVNHLFSIIPLLGMVFSFCWYLVALSDRRIQLDMNKLLLDVENKILEKEDLGLGLYYRINEKYPHTRIIGWDVIDINYFIPIVFFLLWLGGLICLLCHGRMLECLVILEFIR